MAVRRVMSVLATLATLCGLSVPNIVHAQQIMTPSPDSLSSTESNPGNSLFQQFYPFGSSALSGSALGNQTIQNNISLEKTQSSPHNGSPHVSSEGEQSSTLQTHKIQPPSFHVDFAPAAGKGPLATYANGQDVVAFSLQNAHAVKAKSTSSGTVYPDILPGVDVTYSVTNSGLKEGLVLKSNSSPTHFTFTVDVKQVYVRDVTSQGLILYDNTTHKPVAMIPNPVVTDANGTTSKTDATMSACPTKNGQFTVVVNLSQSWLHSKERAFPVVIDPSVMSVTGPVWKATADSVPKGLLGRVDYGSLGMLTPGTSSKELMGLRTSHSETFLNPDGTLTTSMFEAPQFYKDNAGAWQPIVNSIVQSTDPNYAYQNGANTFGAYFGGQADKQHMVHFTVDGDTIDFGLLNGNTASAAVNGNEISFKNAKSNTDLQYSITPNGMKEDIVLNSASASNSISFTMNLTGLTYKQEADGSVDFIDNATSQPVAWIPAPVMTDATGQTSNAVTQTIVNNGDGSYTVTLTADSSWLNAPGRSFPVTVDPSVTITPGTKDSRDSFTSSAYPNSNYSSSTVLYAGSTASYGSTGSFIDFQNLPSLLPGATGTTIQSAYLDVYQTNSGEGGMPLSVEPATKPWESGTVTWNTDTGLGSPIDTETSSSAGSGVYTGHWKFNITSLVKQWYSEQSANYGLAIVGGSSSYASFVSGDDTSSTYAGDNPSLQITYSVQPVGQEPFWSETSDGVNLLDGNLDVTAADLDTPGRGYDLSVTRTYNSLMQNNPAPAHTNLFGPGWASNLDMSIADWGRGPIVFTDANGLQHIFVTTDNYKGQWACSDAEHLQLTVNNGYTITEQDGTKIYFNSSRKLTSITVPTQNNGTDVTTFGYNASGQFSTVTDPSGRVMTVGLNSSGQISTITDPAGRVASYAYTNGNLTSVTIAAKSGSTDTTTVEYGYDPTTGMLSSYTDANGVQTTYNYTNNEVSSVTTPITVNGSVVNATNSYTYSTDSSGNPTTTVTDANGNTNAYTLNTNGNVTQVKVGTNSTATGFPFTTKYSWDQFDQLQSVTDPNQHTTTYTYDNTSGSGTNVQANGIGEPYQTTDANGNIQYSSYNGNGQMAGKDDNNASVSRNYFNNTQITDSVDGLGMNLMTDYNQYGLPTQVSAPVALGQNMVPNSSFEFSDSNGLPTDWQTVSGTGTVSVSTNAEVGTHGLQIKAGSTLSSDTSDELGTSTGILYIPVQPGKTYALSAWVNTSDVSGYNGAGACITQHWYQTKGSSELTYSGPVYLDNMLGTNRWTRETTQITAPANANYLVFNLVLYGNTGSATWDGVQLEPLNSAASQNIVLNNSFKDNPPNATLPDMWGTVNANQLVAKIDTSATGGHNGGYSMILGGGNTGEYAQIYQYITVPQYAYNGITLSGWVKQSGGTTVSTSYFGVKLNLIYPDGSQNSTNVRLYGSFSTPGWQYLSGTFSKSQLYEPNQTTNILPVKIEVYGDYDYVGGTNPEAWFNDIQAQFEAAASSAGDYNLLNNPGFESSFNQTGWPDFWHSALGGGSAAYVSTDGSTSQTGEVHTGTHALELIPESSSVAGATSETVPDTANYSFYNHNFTLVGYIHTVDMAGDDAYLRLDALDANGNVIKSFYSQKLGHTTADSAGNVAWTRVDAVMLASQAPAGTASVEAVLVVDPDGNGSNAVAYFDDILLDQTDLFSSIAYDSNNNYATQVTDPSGDTMNMYYTGSDNSNGAFSANFTGVNTGDPSQMTDPNGNNSYFGYNKFDQITGYTYTAQVNGSTINPTFNYTYDGNGNLKSIQDPVGQQLSYQYNQFNLPTSQTETVGGVAETTTESYNAGGLLTGVNAPNGSSSSLTYDAANRLTGVTDKLGATTDTFGYGYDNNSNLTSVTTGSSKVYTYGYDYLNQLSTVSHPYSTTVNNTESFTPDPNGNITKIAYGVGSTTWNVNNTYNDGNQLMQTTDGTGTVNFAYAPSGLIENASDASGVTTYYTYNPNLQVSEVRSVDKNGNVIEDYSYTYDANGNLKQVTNNTSNSSLSFTYDSLNQLTKETTWTGDTVTYGYDKVGNRTSVTDSNKGTTTNYSYNAEYNRLTSVGSNSISYDANGQMTGYGATTYTWNAENLLSKVTSGSQVDNYTYDPFGRRTTINGNNVAYIGSSNLVAYETNSGNGVVSRFVYDSSGLPVLWYYNGKEYGYVYDGLGNIIGLVDDNSADSTYGTRIVSYTYDAWGNVLTHTDSTNSGLDTANPFVYRGYWCDWDTGLYYLNARYYNPQLGRLLSEDPVSPKVGHALSYNEFSYVQNNPLSSIDPTGMDETGVGREANDITSADEGRGEFEIGADGMPQIGQADARESTYLNQVESSNSSTVKHSSKEGATVRAESTVKNNPLHNTQYTDKVKAQMNKGPGEHHSFPTVVDNYGSLGERTSVIGGDGIARTKIEIRGAYNSKLGVFQYIIEPDGITVNHRLFVPW